jgi:hypothetical protein
VPILAGAFMKEKGEIEWIFASTAFWGWQILSGRKESFFKILFLFIMERKKKKRRIDSSWRKR